MVLIFFFFNDTATTEIYTLSLHDALPISLPPEPSPPASALVAVGPPTSEMATSAVRTTPATQCLDRKSTRLNSSHANISYAVFCLKKKKKNNRKTHVKN